MFGCIVKRLNRLAGKIAAQYFSQARSEEGERVVFDISIIGSNQFRDEVTESIHLLKNKYPFGYSLLQRYISAIVAFSRRIDYGVVEGLCFEVPMQNGNLPWHTDRFAALLVRDAILARLAKHDLCIFRNPRVQSLAWEAELRCMKMLGCHSDYIKQQEDYIRLRGRQEGVRVGLP
jgi:hypothetical protein